MRPSSVVLSVCTALALGLAAAPAEAQLDVAEPKRFEITPVAGYQWGGSFDVGAGSGIPAGTMRLKGSFAWGAIVSFLASMGSAVELIYHRQDTDLEFDPVSSATNTNLGGFAVNYIQLGGRQQFGHSEKFHPFISGSLGVGILDPKAESLGSSTRFSWSLGGGINYMLSSGRVGLRSDIKWWNTPVPSGEIGVWCGFYACVAAEGTDWISQGQWSGGLVFTF
jgi:opacity protein-like surface antigen